MLSAKARWNIFRIIPFGIIWLVFSFIYTQLERGLLGHLTRYPSTGNPYNYKSNLIVTPLFALITGLITGSLEILYFNKLFIKKTFIKKIVYKSILYLGIVAAFLLVSTISANITQLHATVFDKQVWIYAWAFFTNYSFFSVILFITTIIFAIQFYNEVSENLGQAVLMNFFTGKYHTPREEERIFMFLDMRSSTTIAESLGHVKYFRLLREYYTDLSDPVINFHGEIYQYVGDEMVISWKLKNGLDKNNCIKCFFAMQTALARESAKYHRRFGILPSFKAGFHFGKVTAGEIGALKKEIIFTGDVLNTTARIQGLCNSYNVGLLVSGDLVKVLEPDSQLKVEALGNNKLRGRDEKIDLFTITNIA